MFSAELLDAVLTHCLNHPVFLQEYGHVLSIEHFRSKTLPYAADREITARIILDAWKLRQEHVGRIFRTLVDQYAKANRFPDHRKKSLLLYAKTVATAPADSCESIGKLIRETITKQIIHTTMEELVDQHTGEGLNLAQLDKALDEAKRRVAKLDLASLPFLDGVEERIAARRALAKYDKFWTGIAPLDKLLRHAISKGTFNAVLGIAKGGKSTTLAQLAMGAVLQGARTLYLSLEDPKEVCESRLDAYVSGIPTHELHHYEKEVRTYVNRYNRLVKGSIKVKDGTSEHWTVQDIDNWIQSEIQNKYVPDVVLVDYLGEVMPDTKRENKRHEYMDMGSSLRRVAASRNVVLWTAFQGNLEADTIHARELNIGSIAEAKGLVRIVNLMIGLGRGDYEIPKEEYLAGVRSLYMQVVAAKAHVSNVGTNIVGDLSRARIWDRELTDFYAKQEVNKTIESEDAEKKEKKRR